MNAYSAMVIHNVALIVLTAASIWFTGSLWSVLILLFCTKVTKGEDS